jgi:GntR family transcriptional regulator
MPRARQAPAAGPSTAPHYPAGRLLQTALPRFLRAGVAKYLSLREALADLVHSGALAEGDKLPPETALASLTGLSLGTVQRALALLAEDGLLQRRHGSGSYVAGVSSAMESPLHCRFADDAGAGYLPVYPQILAREKPAPDPHAPWQRHLNAQMPVCIDRVLQVGDTDTSGQFNVHSRFYADAARFPAFANAPLRALARENFKSVILRASGLVVARIEQALSVSPIPADAAPTLGLPAGTMTHWLRVATYTTDGRPAYYQELRVPLLARPWHLATDGRDPGPLGRAKPAGAPAGQRTVKP